MSASGTDRPLPRVPDVESLVLAPLTIAVETVAAFAVGEAGESQVEAYIRGLAAERPTGKFSKLDSYYVPFEIPPVFWEYRCETCRFYQEANADAGTCDVVGRAGDPFGGEAISPQAYCAWWMPEADDEPFDWIRNRLAPPVEGDE